MVKVKVTPCLGADHIYDGALSGRHPFHDGSSSLQTGPVVLFVVDALLHSSLFNTLSFLDVAAGGLED